MAQPVHTHDTYDQVGIREDLSDIITNISPEETPFYTACGKTKAANTLHEWQTDALAAAAENAHVEGGDTTATAVTPTVRLGNYTQIMKKAVSIPGTDSGIDKAGRAKEMSYQLVKKTAELKLDIEKALFANQARSAGSSTTARFMAGAPAWLVTNTNFQSGASGANPTGDGTDARTDDGTPTAFSQTKFDDVMQDIWVSGGKPESVYLSSFQMNLALGFTGNNNQRSTVKSESEKVIKHMAVYVTPWGTVEFKPARHNRGRDVFIMEDDKWKVANLRSLKSTELARTGDSEKRQLVCEQTLVCLNEAASGGIFDNTVS